MKEEPKYHIEGNFLTRSEYIEFIYKTAQKIPDPEIRKNYIDTCNKSLELEIKTVEGRQNLEFKKEGRKDLMQTIILPIIGIIGLVGMLFFAFYNPSPSKFQSGVYWIILSLLAAAFGAMIPGFVKLKYGKMIRAGGGIAIFLIMYLLVPAIMKNDAENENIKLNLFVAREDSTNIQAIPIDFQPNSSSRICDYTQKYLSDNYGGDFNKTDSFTFYRKSDGLIYSNQACRDIKEHEILMISNKVLTLFKNKRDAYLHFFNMLR